MTFSYRNVILTIQTNMTIKNEFVILRVTEEVKRKILNRAKKLKVTVSKFVHNILEQNI